MNEHDTKYKAVIHDGNGTWFGVSSLHVALLSTEELEELESGNEHVLTEFGSAPLATLLAKSDDEDIEWDW